MADIKDRIKLVRTTLGKTQAEFAQAINRTQSLFARYENGTNNINDRTIADICREFNINEQWLRAGEGPMFKQQDNLDNMLTADVAKLVRSSDEFTKKLIHNYLSLPQEARDEVKKFILKLAQEDK